MDRYDVVVAVEGIEVAHIRSATFIETVNVLLDSSFLPLPVNLELTIWQPEEMKVAKRPKVLMSGLTREKAEKASGLTARLVIIPSMITAEHRQSVSGSLQGQRRGTCWISHLSVWFSSYHDIKKPTSVPVPLLRFQTE